MADIGVCRRCEARGKTWNGGDPSCGFLTSEFSADNWMCATLNDLREFAEEVEAWNEDQYAAVLPIPGEGTFIILGWYKHRGRTEYAGLLDEGEVRPLTLEVAERALIFLERKTRPPLSAI